MSLDGRAYVLLRFAFGLTAFLWLLSTHPFLDLFYGAEGLCPPERFAFSPAIVTLIWWVGLAACLFTMFGWSARPALVLLFPCLLFFFKTPCRPDNYGDQIFVSLAFLMMFCPTGRRDGLCLPLRAVASDVPREAAWLHKTLRLYAGTIYLMPVIHRWDGDQWWNGTALWTILADPSTSRVWQLLSRDPWMIPTWAFTAVTYGSLAFESLFPFLVWVRRLRLPIVIFGLLFHIGMGALLDLGLFPLQMMVVLIGCLEDGDIIWPWPVRRADPTRPALHPKA